MDNYIVSARKYRPSTFSSVVGQKALTSTLKNAIAQNRLAHAYLFCGSRGVGKTSCARIFAKTINCEHPTPDGDPCNECESCRTFNAGTSLNIVELDAASNNSVDDVRGLVDQVQVPPTNGRYRVFIIDEVHMLSSAAFNAFLKTLEEPPSYVVFILATTEKHKIIPTILSRCQIYDFNRITISDMVDHLAYVASQEGIEAERSALGVIASKADGAMRDALSIFDQVAASSRGKITYKSAIDNLNVLDAAYYSRLVDCFLNQDVPGALLIYKEIRDKGFDSHFFINGLAAYMRDLMVSGNPATVQLVDTDDATRRLMMEQAAKCQPQFLYKAMSLCNDADLNYRQASGKTFLVELLLIKLCQLLSPSPIFSGDGEGQLKPLVAVGKSAAADATPRANAAPAASSPAPQAPAARPAPPIPPVAPSRPAPPVTRRRTTTSLHTISITGKDRQAEADNGKSATESNAPVPTRRERYDHEKLIELWKKYMADRPKEHILVNTMRASRPVEIPEGDPFHYTVTVEIEQQRELLMAEMPRLLAYLHDGLKNDFITLDILINDGPSSPSTWNEREVLAFLQKERPHIDRFVKSLKLSLN